MPHPPSDDLSDAPVGLILHDGGDGAAALLAAFAAELRGLGIDVGGLVQRDAVDAAGRPRMELVDVRSGEVFPISLDLGPGSESCSLDTAGLAEASSVLRREIAAGVALLVVNKFSSREAEGEGLAAEMFEAIAGGIPLLTTLNRRHRPRWDEMTGGVGTMLPPDPATLQAWWRRVSA